MRDRAPWQIDGAAIVRAALQGDPDARAAVEEIVLAVFKREWAARKERQEKITGAEAARRLERVLWNDPATGVMRHADAGSGTEVLEGRVQADVGGGGGVQRQGLGHGVSLWCKAIFYTRPPRRGIT